MLASKTVTYRGLASDELTKGIDRFSPEGPTPSAARPESLDPRVIDSRALANLFDAYGSVNSQRTAVSCPLFCA